MKLTRRFTEIFFACLWLLLPITAHATDVTISAQTWTNLPFNATNLGTDRSITVSVTNSSTTVTSSAAFPANIVGIGGFKVAIGGTTYTVSTIASTSSLTLTSAYSGSTGSAVMTLYKYVLLRAYATASFQPYGETYVIQPGTPGSGSFYKQVAASIINNGSSNVLYTPEFTLPATTNATINNQATYVLGWYRPDGSLIQFLVCGSVQQLALPTSTPTTFGALCTYNSPGGVVPPNNQVYTTTQIDNRFPSCSSGQLLYYAANGNVQSCLTVGTNLSISSGTLNASGGGGGGITIGSTSISGGSSNQLLYHAAGNVVGELGLGFSLTISGGILKNQQVKNAINLVDYGADPSGVSNSTTAIVNWITACQASYVYECYAPAGIYLTDPITLSINGLRLVGDGREKTVFKARVANNPVVAITGANYAVNFTIDGIGFQGQGKASGSSGHCVSISDSSGGTAQFSIKNASFTNCGGKGLYIPYMFAGHFENNIFDEIGDNHMEIQGGSGTVVARNDFKTLEASKVALWIYSGNPVVAGNNGIEPDSGASTVWGRFGRSTSEGDSTDSYVLGGTFTGNNVEDFKGVGWQFRTGSGGSTYAGNTFISPSSGTVTALYYYFLSGTELGIWSGGTFTLQGTAAWTSGYPVHARGYAPFYTSGTNTPASFYEWNAAEARTLPYIRPKLLAGTTKNGLQISEAMIDALYDSSLAGTVTGTTDPSGNASRILLQNGTAARPVYGSSTDSTTGLYFASSTIGFSVGGTVRATLTNAAFVPTVKTTFTPSATLAGMNVGSVAGDPSTPANGDIWYDSTNNLLRARIAGSTVNLSAGSGGTPGGSSGNLQWNNAGSFAGVSGSTATSLGYLTLAPTASSSGSPTLLTLTGPAHTALAADTEATDVNWNLSRSVQFTAGGATFSTQRAMRIQAPTYTMTSADTIAKAVTLGLNTATAGTNATITESIGIEIAPTNNADLGLSINGQSSATGDLLRLGLNGTYIFRVDPVNGDLNYVFVDSALGTTATDGFIYYPSMAGTPTGVPTSYTGTVATVVDSTNNRFYGYIGGSWVNLSAGGASINSTNEYVPYRVNATTFADAPIRRTGSQTVFITDGVTNFVSLGTGGMQVYQDGSSTFPIINVNSAGGLYVDSSNLVVARGGSAHTAFASGQILSVSAGTVSAPAFSFNGDANTGVYQVGADTLGLTAGGVATFQVTATYAQVGGAASAQTLRFLEPSGSGSNYTAIKAQAQSADITYTLPAAQGAAGTSLVNDGSGGLSWGTASPGLFGDGSVSAPSISFAADTNTGFYRNITDTISATVGGTGMMSVTTDGLTVGFVDQFSYATLYVSGRSAIYPAAIIRSVDTPTNTILEVTRKVGVNDYDVFTIDSYGEILGAVRPRSSTATSTPFARFMTPEDSSITAGTEAVGIQFGGNSSKATLTRTWATGALATQRESLFIGPTYNFAALSTLTTAATVAIDGPPIAGANAVITTPISLWVQSGNVTFGSTWGTQSSQNYGAAEYDIGSTSGSVTANWNNGNHQKVTMTGNITTFTWSNIKQGAFYVMQLVQDGTGGRTVAKPSNVIIPGGASGGNITGLTATANAVDELWCRSNGTTITCFVVADVKN